MMNQTQIKIWKQISAVFDDARLASKDYSEEGIANCTMIKEAQKSIDTAKVIDVFGSVEKLALVSIHLKKDDEASLMKSLELIKKGGIHLTHCSFSGECPEDETIYFELFYRSMVNSSFALTVDVVANSKTSEVKEVHLTNFRLKTTPEAKSLNIALNNEMLCISWKYLEEALQVNALLQHMNEFDNHTYSHVDIKDICPRIDSLNANTFLAEQLPEYLLRYLTSGLAKIHFDAQSPIYSVDAFKDGLQKAGLLSNNELSISPLLCRFTLPQRLIEVDIELENVFDSCRILGVHINGEDVINTCIANIEINALKSQKQSLLEKGVISSLSAITVDSINFNEVDHSLIYSPHLNALKLKQKAQQTLSNDTSVLLPCVSL